MNPIPCTAGTAPNSTSSRKQLREQKNTAAAMLPAVKARNSTLLKLGAKELNMSAIAAEGVVAVSAAVTIAAALALIAVAATVAAAVAQVNGTSKS